MVRIAIVEDDPSAVETLNGHLARYEQAQQVKFSVSIFKDAVMFLTDYRPVYDIVFMDIEMPHLLGTDAAKRLREVDPVVALVFITNMSQYAIKGYEVDAIDYVLKPVTYYRFSTLLQKILRRVETERDCKIVIRTPNGMQRVDSSQITYVMVEDHLLLYHTGNEVIEAWGSLKTAEELLPQDSFARCNKSCIVNLKYVKSLVGDSVTIENQSIGISRGRKKDFLKALNDYLGKY